MAKLKITACPFDGMYIIEPTVHYDQRGYFMETYNQRDLQALGLDIKFVQDNQSMSRKGVLRGLHFQTVNPQGKLLWASYGRFYDVVVDLRSGSKTFGQWYGMELSDENKKQVYIPAGFAHGFLTLSDVALLNYKCTEFYQPGSESGLAWNDPTLAINWPEVVGTYQGTPRADGYTLTDGTPLILSAQDQTWPLFKDAFVFD